MSEMSEILAEQAVDEIECHIADYVSGEVTWADLSEAIAAAIVDVFDPHCDENEEVDADVYDEFEDEFLAVFAARVEQAEELLAGQVEELRAYVDAHNAEYE